MNPNDQLNDIRLCFSGDYANELRQLAEYKGLTVGALIDRALALDAALTKEVDSGKLVVITNKRGEAIKEVSPFAI